MSQELRDFRLMAIRLYEFEGPSSLWRFPAALLVAALVPAVLIASAVLASLIASGKFSLASATAAAVVALIGTALLAPRLRSAQLGRALLERRLSRWECWRPGTEIEVLIPRFHLGSAQRVLRRAGFNPGASCLTLGQPPPDAPELDTRLRVQEPFGAEADAERLGRLLETLRGAGVRGRAGNIDVAAEPRPAPRRPTTA